MTVRGLTADKRGDDSVSSAPVGEPDMQTRLDRPVAPQSFTPGGSRKTSRVWFDDREYWVYAHHAADGTVLYVGCTANRDGRQRTHRASSPWYPLVARTAYKGPFDRADGLGLERHLIEKYDPPNNFMHTSRYVHKRSLKAS